MNYLIICIVEVACGRFQFFSLNLDPLNISEPVVPVKEEDGRFLVWLAFF